MLIPHLVRCAVVNRLAGEVDVTCELCMCVCIDRSSQRHGKLRLRVSVFISHMAMCLFGSWCFLNKNSYRVSSYTYTYTSDFSFHICDSDDPASPLHVACAPPVLGVRSQLAPSPPLSLSFACPSSVCVLLVACLSERFRHSAFP